MSVTQAELERSPDYWWLRFRYAMRDGRTDEAEEARRRLKALGVQVELVEPATRREGASR